MLFVSVQSVGSEEAQRTSVTENVFDRDVPAELYDRKDDPAESYTGLVAIHERDRLKNESSSPVALEDAPDFSRFYARSKLSIPPVLLLSPDIEGAELAELEEGVFDVLRIRLFISRSGEVVKVESVSNQGSDDQSERLFAIFKNARFLPARLDGIAVNSQIELELDVADVSAGSSRVSDHKEGLSGKSG